jgi:hypothetical protein
MRLLRSRLNTTLCSGVLLSELKACYFLKRRDPNSTFRFLRDRQIATGKAVRPGPPVPINADTRPAAANRVFLVLAPDPTGLTELVSRQTPE